MLDVTDRAVGWALDEERFLRAAAALAELRQKIVDELDAGESGDRPPLCIEATRAPKSSARGYLEGWYRIRCGVRVIERAHPFAGVKSTRTVAVDVLLGFAQPNIAHVMAARVGSRTLSRGELARVLPEVEAWRPKVPGYWYALALLRESPPPGQCGTCLSEPYERCKCAPTSEAPETATQPNTRER